jgi:hypothetical protein
MSKAMYPGRYMALSLSVWDECHVVQRGYNTELPAGTGLKKKKQLSGVEVGNASVCFTLREAAAEPVDHATDPDRLPREKNLQAGFVEHILRIPVWPRQFFQYWTHPKKDETCRKRR